MATLIDKITRHQVYLEGLKNGQDKEIQAYLVKLYRDLFGVLANLTVDDLGALTKARLRSLIAEVREVHKDHASRVSIELLNFLRAFMEADKQLASLIYNEDEENPVVWGGTTEQQWATVENDPIPANGVFLSAFISAYLAHIFDDVSRAVRQGYANHWTLAELRTALTGPRGLRRRHGFQGAAVLSTAMQHVSDTVHFNIARLLHDRYMWLSILDEATTDICRSRHKKLYEYGKGPRPPAHVNCRSRIAPYTETVNVSTVPDSYYAWLRTQPPAILRDLLGAQRAARMQRGEMKAADIPRFETPRPLTLPQFVGKRKFILTD